jgi:hypothetical protein
MRSVVRIPLSASPLWFVQTADVPYNSINNNETISSKYDAMSSGSKLALDLSTDILCFVIAAAWMLIIFVGAVGWMRVYQLSAVSRSFIYMIMFMLIPFLAIGIRVVANKYGGATSLFSSNN